MSEINPLFGNEDLTPLELICQFLLAKNQYYILVLYIVYILYTVYFLICATITAKILSLLNQFLSRYFNPPNPAVFLSGDLTLPILQCF